MASVQKRFPDNVEGDFFVDSTCINCDTCRQLAPEVFAETDDHSFVYSQPSGEDTVQKALRALICCPTASIGTLAGKDVKAVVGDFPMLLDGGVYYCGFNSKKSYGGNSYFVIHEGGNWLIDSPRYVSHLADAFARYGGIKYIFLTHEDDVADSDKFAERFGAVRIIHERSLAAAPDAGIVLHGTDPTHLADDWLVIPTPGHTAGHCVLLYRNEYLFSGDHMWWDPHAQSLQASRRVCWYSWSEQIESLDKLRPYSFQWVLPGHGSRMHLSSSKMKQSLDGLVARLKGS